MNTEVIVALDEILVLKVVTTQAHMPPSLLDLKRHEKHNDLARQLEAVGPLRPIGVCCISFESRAAELLDYFHCISLAALQPVNTIRRLILLIMWVAQGVVRGF